MRPKIPLPRGWRRHTKAAILSRSWPSATTPSRPCWLGRPTSRSGRTRVRAEIDRLSHELALLREELRIKNARMTRVPPHRRPHYTPLERMAILELRAARGLVGTDRPPSAFILLLL